MASGLSPLIDFDFRILMSVMIGDPSPNFAFLSDGQANGDVPQTSQRPKNRAPVRRSCWRMVCHALVLCALLVPRASCAVEPVESSDAKAEETTVPPIVLDKPKATETVKPVKSLAGPFSAAAKNRGGFWHWLRTYWWSPILIGLFWLWLDRRALRKRLEAQQNTVANQQKDVLRHQETVRQHVTALEQERSSKEFLNTQLTTESDRANSLMQEKQRLSDLAGDAHKRANYAMGEWTKAKTLIATLQDSVNRELPEAKSQVLELTRQLEQATAEAARQRQSSRTEKPPSIASAWECVQPS